MFTSQILRFAIIGVCLLFIILAAIDKETRKSCRALTISGLVLYLLFKEVMAPITTNNTNNTIWIIFAIVVAATLIVNIFALVFNLIKKAKVKSLIASIGGTALALIYPIIVLYFLIKG